MDEDLVDRIWADISDRVGDDLRVVTCYEPTAFETRMRPDVRANYTTNEDRLIVNETIVNQLGLQGVEKEFKTGGLEAFVRVFEDAWVLSWIDGLSTKSGVIVSIQRDGQQATMDDVEWCTRYLSNEVGSLLE